MEMITPRNLSREIQEKELANNETEEEPCFVLDKCGHQKALWKH